MTIDTDNLWKVDMSPYSERGAAIIIVSISLLMLMGIAALAIDGGMAYRERRSTQGAADHAALAAAWAACNPQGLSPKLAGEEAAARNGYPAGPQVSVSIQPGESPHSYEAIISSTEGTRFARSSGRDEITVISRAVADCKKHVWGGGYALFAMAPPGCFNPGELKLTGSAATIDGDVHTNGRFHITASGTVTGAGTHVGAHNNPSITFSGGLHSVAPQDDPFTLNFSDFRPENNIVREGIDYFSRDGTIDLDWLNEEEHASGNVLTQSGVYYGAAGVDLHGIRMGTGVRATFVSPQLITVGGPGAQIDAYDPSGVVLFSNAGNANCSNPLTTAIKFNPGGGGGNWTGLIYAPRGEIDFSPNTAASFNGSIVGWILSLQPAGMTLNYHDVTGEGPDYEIQLSE